MSRGSRILLCAMAVSLVLPVSAGAAVISQQPLYDEVNAPVEFPYMIVGPTANATGPSPLQAVTNLTGTLRSVRLRYDALSAEDMQYWQQVMLFGCPHPITVDILGTNPPECDLILSQDPAHGEQDLIVYLPDANGEEVIVSFEKAFDILDNHQYTDGVPLDPTWSYTLQIGGQPTISLLYGHNTALGFEPFYIFEDIVGTTTATTTPPVCTENCNSNVMFLPGIQGSRLYGPGTIFEDRLWEPSNESDVNALLMNSAGESIRDDIYTKESDVIDEIPFTTANIYKSFLNHLDSWKMSDNLIEDYSVVAYDWRLSLNDILNYGNQIEQKIYYSGSDRATSTPYIIQELKRLVADSRNGKVTIVAHSNGGLVAKALLRRLEQTNDPLLAAVDKLILVAVPQSGTPQAIGAAVHGYQVALPLDVAPLILSPEKGRAFAANSPMIYHLLPSARYQDDSGASVQTPVVTFDPGAKTNLFVTRYGTSIDSAAELTEFLQGAEGRSQSEFTDLNNPSILSPELLQYGRLIHEELDSWTPPTSLVVHEIAGWGVPTLAGIRYWTGKECLARTLLGLCTQTVPKLLYSPETVIDGDGKVVTPSALAISSQAASRWWVDLDAYNAENIDRDHASILEIQGLSDFVASVLDDSLNVSPEYVYTTQPIPSASDKRLVFLLHSPLDLLVEDSGGNKLNVASAEVPGGYFRRFGEVQFASVPEAAHPKLTLRGRGSGSFTLEIRAVESGRVVQFAAFTGIPSATTTLAEITLPDGTIDNATSLAVDFNGDGVVEHEYDTIVGRVTEPEIDKKSPEAVISVSTTTKNFLITGLDDSSSTVVSDGELTTITDESGNKTFLKTKNTLSAGFLVASKLLSVQYGDASTTPLSASFAYVWNRANEPVSQTVVVDKNFAIEALFDSRKRCTTIIVLRKNVPIQVKAVSGLAIIKLTTQDGGLKYSW